MLNKLFNLENSVPLYTQNREAYDSERKAWFIAKYNGTPASELEEDKVMADVHAYFQVASKVRLLPQKIEPRRLLISQISPFRDLSPYF